MTQHELDRRLFEAVTESEKINLTYIEELLKLGADPLGSDNVFEEDGHIFKDGLYIEDIFINASENEALAECIEDIMDLFFKYGMDIDSAKEYDKYSDGSPMWSLAFNSSESGLKILRKLLDRNVDVTSVEEMIEHILTDMGFLSCDDLSDLESWFYERDVFSIKMIMFAASYNYILNGSDYIRRKIQLDKNNFDTEKFRNYDDFDYRIDVSGCKKGTGFEGSVITVTEKVTGKTVWILEI